jgi:hypothetical protein
MTVQKVLLLVSTLFFASCSSMIQSASVSEAYKKAELTYLKARTHEGLGEQEIACTLYEYLAEQHRDSQYGYLASKKLNSGL